MYMNNKRCMEYPEAMEMGKKEMPKRDDMMAENFPGVVCPPVYECPVERVCHRQIVHEVPHVCPVNTRIVNHHIYRHSYSPCYTCCEENEVCNVYENKCCF